MTDENLARQWLIVVGLALGPAVSNGFGRFAYGLVLPAMRDDLGWTYTQAGWIGTANAIGYLIGALVALKAIQKLNPGNLFLSGMCVVALSLLFSGLTQNFWFLSLWRLLAGFAGAWVFISGGVMVSFIFKRNPSKSALAIGLYFGGVGVGIFLSGATIPLLLQHLGASTWPQMWLWLGALSCIALLPTWAAVSALRLPTIVKKHHQRVSLPLRKMLAEIIGYFFFGIGYIVHLTFLVAWMQTEKASAVVIALTWSVIGIGGMISPFPWRSFLARSNSGMPLALACAATGTATLLPLYFSGPIGFLASSVVFGLAFFVTPSAVTNFSQKNLPEAQWGTGVAMFTTAFAAGQILGPLAAGAISDQSDNITLGLTCAGAIQLLGGAIAAMQKPLKQ